VPTFEAEDPPPSSPQAATAHSSPTSASLPADWSELHLKPPLRAVYARSGRIARDLAVGARHQNPRPWSWGLGLAAVKPRWGPHPGPLRRNGEGSRAAALAAQVALPTRDLLMTDKSADHNTVTHPDPSVNETGPSAVNVRDVGAAGLQRRVRRAYGSGNAEIAANLAGQFRP